MYRISRNRVNHHLVCSVQFLLVCSLLFKETAKRRQPRADDQLSRLTVAWRGMTYKRGMSISTSHPSGSLIHFLAHQAQVQCGMCGRQHGVQTTVVSHGCSTTPLNRDLQPTSNMGSVRVHTYRGHRRPDLPSLLCVPSRSPRDVTTVGVEEKNVCPGGNQRAHDPQACSITANHKDE